MSFIRCGKRVVTVAVSALCATGFLLSSSAGADPSGHASGLEATITTPILSTSVPPTPIQMLPPGGGKNLVSVNVPGTISAGALAVSSQEEGSSGATSSASALNVDALTGTATAGVLSSTCSADPSSGTAALANAQALGVPVNANPPPNTVVPIPLLGSITFNEQHTTSSGIVVRAMHVNISTPFGTVTDLIVSESACFAGADVLAATATRAGVTQANPNLTG
jgi:hypothetical protein